jgi:hypothetical protein
MGSSVPPAQQQQQPTHLGHNQVTENADQHNQELNDRLDTKQAIKVGMAQLLDMGFLDDLSNFAALERANGCVQEAVDTLLQM